jgi:preprotein translocase subunit SecG
MGLEVPNRTTIILAAFNLATTIVMAYWFESAAMKRQMEAGRLPDRRTLRAKVEG